MYSGKTAVPPGGGGIRDIDNANTFIKSKLKPTDANLLSPDSEDVFYLTLNNFSFKLTAKNIVKI
jgi:hypothetical protein